MIDSYFSKSVAREGLEMEGETSLWVPKYQFLEKRWTPVLTYIPPAESLISKARREQGEQILSANSWMRVTCIGPDPVDIPDNLIPFTGATLRVF